MFQRCWNDALSSQNEKFYGKNRFRFWSLCQPNLSAIALEESVLTNQAKQDSSINDDHSKNSSFLQKSPVLSSLSYQEIYLKTNYELVKDSLIILTEFIQKIPMIRDSMFEIRADLQAISSQISSIVAYKKLHDLLYKFQLYCYYPIEETYRRIVDGELDIWNELNIYEGDIQKTIDDMYAAIDQRKLSDDEILWIKDFEKAKERFRVGIEESNRKEIEKFIWYANFQVLSNRPALINKCLTTRVGSLRLNTLQKKMVCLLREKLNSYYINSNPEKINAFESGVNALMRLEQELTNLSNEHNAWQDLDRELHMFEGCLRQDTSDIEVFWESLNEKMKLLCFERQNPDKQSGLAHNIIPEKRRKDLTKNSDALTQAIKSGKLEDIKKYFKQYRRVMSYCFDSIDETLKKQCENLNQISEPLDAVIGVL